MTSYAADARTNAAYADTTDARTNASDTSDPANATDASDATYTTGNTASGATSSTSGGTSSTSGGTSSGTSSTCGGTSSASYTTGNTASYRQRDSADRERCNPETCADDSHTRSSMIISPAMNSEPERHSRRSLTRARVKDVASDRKTISVNCDLKGERKDYLVPARRIFFTAPWNRE
jgi:hypothetical protein